MAKSKNAGSPVEQKLDQLIRLAQDVLILQALQLGMSRGDVRKIARVNTDRVTDVSKPLRRAKTS